MTDKQKISVSIVIMEKNKELSISLEKKIYKQSLELELEKKFDECFLDFNDFNNLYKYKKIKFQVCFTKYLWYQERYLFKKEHLIKNDFFDKFHLRFRNYIPNKKEEVINCMEMFSDYIEYDLEITSEVVFEDGDHSYSFTFKKRKKSKKIT